MDEPSVDVAGEGGLSADDFHRLAAQSSSYVEQLGLEETERRLKLAYENLEALHAAGRDAFGSRFGGIWQDWTAGSSHFVVNVPTGAAAEARVLLSDRRVGALMRAGEVRSNPVDLSESEALGLAGRAVVAVERAGLGGQAPVSVAVDPKTNEVEVEVAADVVAGQPQFVRELRSLGPQVHVRPSRQAEPAGSSGATQADSDVVHAASHTYYGPVLSGGMRTRTCTVGFAVQHVGSFNYGMLTTGHCKGSQEIYPHALLDNRGNKDPVPTSFITEHFWSSAWSRQRRAYLKNPGNFAVDAEYHTVKGQAKSNAVRTGQGFTRVTALGTVGNGFISGGNTVCIFGLAGDDDLDCKTIHAVYRWKSTNDYQGWLVDANYNGDRGDSGAPIFYAGRAIGIHAGRPSSYCSRAHCELFVPIEAIIAKAGLHPILSSSVTEHGVMPNHHMHGTSGWTRLGSGSWTASSSSWGLLDCVSSCSIYQDKVGAHAAKDSRWRVTTRVYCSSSNAGPCRVNAVAHGISPDYQRLGQTGWQTISPGQTRVLSVMSDYATETRSLRAELYSGNGQRIYVDYVDLLVQPT